MILVALVAPVGALAAHVSVARWIAAFAFLSLLLALGWGLLRARQRACEDEADAALEADFRRLEQEAPR